MQKKKELTYEAVDSFIITIKSCNMEQIKRYLNEYDPMIVNRLETQSRQPSLYFAAVLIDHQQSYQVMKMLLQYGANPHFEDTCKQTILFYVCRDGKQKCLELLLNQGLDLNKPDIYGQTPIYYAAKENRLHIIPRLLQKKVYLNHRDELAGQTALFYAARSGHMDMCKILIENGCSLTITDIFKKTAIYYAKKSNKNECYEYLSLYFTNLKDQMRLSNENGDSISKVDERNKKKNQMHSFRLVRTDGLGNPYQISQSEIEELFQIYPELAQMLKNPDAIEMVGLVEIKAKDSWVKIAMKTLNSCSKAKGGHYFTEPVDPIKYKIDDYFDVIKQPMDFGTIKKKLICNLYRNVDEYIKDMNLVFENCVLYNGMDNIVAKYAIEIRESFLENMKQTGFID